MKARSLKLLLSREEFFEVAALANRCRTSPSRLGQTAISRFLERFSETAPDLAKVMRLLPPKSRRHHLIVNLNEAERQTLRSLVVDSTLKDSDLAVLALRWFIAGGSDLPVEPAYDDPADLPDAPASWEAQIIRFPSGLPLALFVGIAWPLWGLGATICAAAAGLV